MRTCFPTLTPHAKTIFKKKKLHFFHKKKLINFFQKSKITLINMFLRSNRIINMFLKRLYSIFLVSCKIIKTKTSKELITFQVLSKYHYNCWSSAGFDSSSSTNDVALDICISLLLIDFRLVTFSLVTYPLLSLSLKPDSWTRKSRETCCCCLQGVLVLGIAPCWRSFHTTVFWTSSWCFKCSRFIFFLQLGFAPVRGCAVVVVRLIGLVRGWLYQCWFNCIIFPFGLTYTRVNLLVRLYVPRLCTFVFINLMFVCLKKKSLQLITNSYTKQQKFLKSA